MKELNGIIAPIPTSFDEREDLALDRLTENIERWSQSRLSGFAVLGSTGEFVYLAREEKERVLGRAREAIPADRVLLAGTGCESTRETIALTRFAAKAGADLALVVTPAYYKRGMKPEVLRAHYFEVAENSPIPVVLYNIPGFTGLNLSAELVVELAAHSNIVGIKDSSGDLPQLQEICRLAPDDFAVLTGAGSLLLASLVAGARGAILAVANVVPDLCVDLVEAFQRGDLARARTLQHHLSPINKVVTFDYGVAGLKSLLDQIGFYGGPPRRPLRGVSAEVREKLLEIHDRASRVAVSGS
ncbi:MAG TPA: dihydrodipicolinate synthase family protein [Vicinamibacteria bacterium]